MQTYIEPIFDIIYLVSVITMGIIMVSRKSEYRLFGIMAIVLGGGDSFHLVPRIYSLMTDTMSENYAMLGFGKLITSVTMTVFYVLLYHFWRKHYNIKGRKLLTYIVYSLSVIRVALCLFPQNDWMAQTSSYAWGIYRNIPFLILGIIIVVLLFNKAKDKEFKFAWLAVTLSFAFYAIVVLFARDIPIMGIFMIPKTICYFWLVLMGYRAYKKEIAGKI